MQMVTSVSFHANYQDIRFTMRTEYDGLYCLQWRILISAWKNALPICPVVKYANILYRIDDILPSCPN